MTANAISIKPDSLLRFAIRLDGTVVALFGVVMVLAAGPVSRMSGLPTESMHSAGVWSIAYGPLAFALAAMKRVRPGGIFVIVFNLGSTVAAVATVICGAAWMTPASVGLALAVGVYTAAIGVLQYVGFRRLGTWRAACSDAVSHGRRAR